ncbi:MAG: SOS response-associated peptidase [Burkholderiaceae bacterium]
MCGRITQTRSIMAYARSVGWTEQDLRERDISGYTASYNASPGVPHLILRDIDGQPTAELVMWHFLSAWAKEKGLAPAINAKREKLLGGYYRPMMKTGRVIVPAEGWYEWTGKAGSKQPWYIRAKNDGPLFLAALTNHHPDRPDPEGAGFVIVTDDAAGGMVDVHARRPVVLNADEARLWMDLATPFDQAEQIARTSELSEEYFEWYQVSSEVNRPGREGSRLIEPIDRATLQ